MAAYPFSEDREVYTLDPSNSILNLTLSETPSQEDYMIATNETDTSVEGFSTTVDLQFKHLLTSVGLKIWRDHAKHQNGQMRIKEVTLGNIRKGGTYSTATGEWAYNGDKLTMKFTNDKLTDSDNIGGAIIKDDGSMETGGSTAADPFGEMMLLPQTFNESNSVPIKIVYELKLQNAANWEEAELEAVLPNITLNAGQRYTFNVVLSQVTDITVYYIQTKVDPWGTPQVGGTVIIK